MLLFEKKVTIYKKRDRETWKMIRKVLKEEQIKGVSCGHYLQEAIIAGGCASQIDPRNLGKNGPIDRDIYYINVKESFAERAKAVIWAHGIKAEVMKEEDLMMDAPERIKMQEKD